MSKVLKRLYLGDVVKSFGTKQLRKLTTEEPTESIVGTWVFNEVVYAPSSAIDLTNNDIEGTFYGKRKSSSGSNLAEYPIALMHCGSALSIYSADVGTSDTYVSVDYNGSWHSTKIVSGSGRNYTYTSADGDLYTLVRTINITKDPNNIEFSSWLKANATKQ